MEGASRWKRRRLRNLAPDRRKAPSRVPLANSRLGGHQSGRVRVARGGEQVGERTLLDDLTRVKDVGASANGSDGCQIVGDEEKPEGELAPQAIEESEDPQLNRRVECGRWLVGKQKLGASCEREGEQHSLPLTARELVGIGGQDLRPPGERNHLDELCRRGCGGPPPEWVMGPQHLDELTADGEHRVQRSCWLLENQSEAASPDLPMSSRRFGEEIGAIEEDPSGSNRGVTREQPEDGASEQALSRAGLAHQTDRFARGKVERYAPEDLRPSPSAGREAETQGVDGELVHQARAGRRRAVPSAIRESHSTTRATPNPVAPRRTRSSPPT